MSKWKEGQRRSPRLSVVLDACKPQAMALQQKITRAKARKTRKPTPVPAPFSYQANDVQRSNQHGHEDPPISSDQPSSRDDNTPKLHDDKAASPEWMPEKRILEHILDILQRRDSHEIFAEPVDPEEVEDYYEIIKEPMDFGTMRAKLHEGMYTSLQQFEHDVYLIPQNAMHFNSPTTVYFRQARAIHELATKVFSCLKTEPEKFEFEFPDTKRRSSRRLMCEGRGPSTNLRPNQSSPNHRKSVTGGSGEVDRRCTYTPWTCENASTHSEPLIPVNLNGQDMCYRESLMLFVKDLGPTAQMVANRKLMDASHKPTLITQSLKLFQTQLQAEKEKSNPQAQAQAELDLDLRWRKGFIFDLPFLKKRLQQINPLGNK
ncbi:hypothetical protein HRI_003829300 [Hibiscus trionum]|uniref:Bromo domain-containing protein n=1 Tax=Hibiscus trionum TaxID=183268 RepID=A0A9W7ML77_HIBTR|nr:hypothetical protein HRI_003829300 [Hibiscus trionum]